MNIFKRFLGVAALTVIFSAAASADTLEMKDGRVLEGRYLGGTQVIIRFEIQGDVQTFRVREISALSFERRGRRDRDRRDDGAPPPPNGRYDPPPQDQGRPNDNQGPYDQSQQGDYPPPPADSRDRDDRYRDDRDKDRDRDRTRESRREPVYAQPGTTLTIPDRQAMLVRMIDEVDSKHNVVGDPFHATLETDLVVDNILVARRGSDVYGRLSYAREAGHFSGSSELQLELTRILIDGKEYPIDTGDYTLRGEGRGGDTARKVGGGAVAGAVIGAIAGGGQGAAIGAGVGSAAGAGVQVFTRGRQVRVPSETLLEFRLDQPATVTPTQQ
ncbi:MAG: DUF3824 domain-containing protein [Acidobacteriota bacterium]|nr:DUF3824 domain-containing protein [Acidobacteriota bacterium]